jgi:hypothetical protein
MRQKQRGASVSGALARLWTSGMAGGAFGSLPETEVSAEIVEGKRRSTKLHDACFILFW